MSEKKIITMARIAELARVSKPTVSRALSDSPLVNPATREHVLAVAREHGYAVNRNAQKLRHKRTNTIAVSLDFMSHRKNHIADPFIFDLLAGVSEALGDRNQDLLLCAPNHNDTPAFQKILSSRGADGFIVLGQGHREEMLNNLASGGAPFVVWGASADQTPYCVVGSDNFLGGQLVGRYFLENGRSKLLFVGDITHREYFWRRTGLQSAVDKCASSATIDDAVLSGFSYESAAETADKYLRDSEFVPDAIFASSDTVAMAFICACRDHGLKVPDDVSVVGFNDMPSAAYFYPPLTTIRQDTHQAGETLVSSLMQMLDGIRPESVTLETELIIRKT